MLIEVEKDQSGGQINRKCYFYYAIGCELSGFSHHRIKSIVRSHECVDGGSVLDTLTDPFSWQYDPQNAIFLYISSVEQNASSMDRDE